MGLESSAATTLICPECGGECDRLSDGVCDGCFYVLTGGDLGTENPTWQAWLSHDRPYSNRNAA